MCLHYIISLLHVCDFLKLFFFSKKKKEEKKRKEDAIIVSSKINDVQLNTHINKINDNENKVNIERFIHQPFKST